MFPIQQVFLLPKIKKVQLRQLHPLVIPVGFKPTTFRTSSRPSLSALKTKKVQFLNYTLYCMMRRPETSATKKVQLRQLVFLL